MMHQCPVCGAALAEDSATCSVCKAGLRWRDGKSSPALRGIRAKPLRPLVLAILALAALQLVAYGLVSCGRPPADWFKSPTSLPAAVTASAPRPDGLTSDQAATLASLQRVDDYPLYTMRYAGDATETRAPSHSAASESTTRAWSCSLFAALGNPENRLYGRNFDWRYSPALLLFTERPAAGSYASISMVDIAYLGFSDGSVDLTLLPLAERRALLEAPSWPFDGMNEAGVAVGMAAVPQADERRDPGKPVIDSLEVIREILDHAGSTDEAVAILSRYNIDWEGGPPLHYLVADGTGRAALVEYYAGQILVLPNDGPWHAATNFPRSGVAGDAAGQCSRYDTLVRRLTAASGKLDSNAALGLLQAVSQPESPTQWSVVYGMNTGQVDVVMGRRYDHVRSFRFWQK